MARGTKVNPFRPDVMRRLQALADVGEAISTIHLRESMQLTSQQLHRLTLQADFPKRQQIGVKFWVNPVALLEFAHRWNRLARGLTITQVAQLIHSTVPTTRRLVRQADFPKSLGE